MTPEFARIERLDAIGEGERAVAIAAEPDERSALAARFGLIAVDRLEARFRVRRAGATVLAAGHVAAAVTQACSVTGDALPAIVEEEVALRFVADVGAADKVELSTDALDTMPIENGAIDLGEAAAETMALALDPFPRGPAAEEALRAAGVLREEEAGPFAALAALKRRL